MSVVKPFWTAQAAKTLFRPLPPVSDGAAAKSGIRRRSLDEQLEAALAGCALRIPAADERSRTGRAIAAMVAKRVIAEATGRGDDVAQA
jgi:hypothetical protein